ncbi:MAG: hypothetical protein EBS52_11495 [Betaproteobacteria bacterium]|nr:hypothetical protein [Betaproteobacteria bacterium]
MLGRLKELRLAQPEISPFVLCVACCSPILDRDSIAAMIFKLLFALLLTITGHVQDLRARFADHKKMVGEVLKKGEIDTKAKGQDPVHNASGTWYLIRTGHQLFLQSGEDFRSSPGPDYHVYVSSGPAIKDNPEFSSKQVEVGRLIKPNGAAYYLLKTENLNEVSSVLIWCKQFKEYIGSADLLPAR